MSDPSKRMHCARHGETAATFICRHLWRGFGCGFHDSADADDAWPDAWCDACQVIFDRDGGWTEENPPKITALCTGCYEEARANNRRLPPGLAAGQVTVSDAQFPAFAHAVHRWCEERQARTNARWRFLERAHWSYDREARTMRFFDDDGSEVVADVDVVGSFSTATNTWLWVWDNGAFGDDDCARIEPVRTFGEVRGIRKLTEATWAADEVDGWEVTQIAACLLDADAVYRAPMEHLRVFMLLRSFR